jgi:dihydrodipicolinate synthase/N-acetylneuraminate lyase
MAGPASIDALEGIWSALPTPWRPDGGLDVNTFRGDVARLCDARVNGVYSGGTTGEFYVQDFPLFAEINRALVETARAHRTPVQVGCTALSTDEACRRAAFARGLGADGVQVALPFWMDLDDDEVLAFFSAVAEAAGDLMLIHYDTERARRRIAPKLYAVIRERVPTLAGVKFTGGDLHALGRICSGNPGLRVFIGEHLLASATPLGARGSYSSVVNVDPRWMLDYWHACRDGDWTRAFRIQSEVRTLCDGFERFVTRGMRDTAIDRILGRLAGFLRCPLESKGPYRHGVEEDLQRLREWTRERLPHLFAAEQRGAMSERDLGDGLDLAAVAQEADLGAERDLAALRLAAVDHAHAGGLEGVELDDLTAVRAEPVERCARPCAQRGRRLGDRREPRERQPALAARLAAGRAHGLERAQQAQHRWLRQLGRAGEILERGGGRLAEQAEQGEAAGERGGGRGRKFHKSNIVL